MTFSFVALVRLITCLPSGLAEVFLGPSVSPVSRRSENWSSGRCLTSVFTGSGEIAAFVGYEHGSRSPTGGIYWLTNPPADLCDL